MTKNEFMIKLQEALENDLDASAVRDNVNYYSNYIDDEIRKGRSEEEVLDELGDPWVIAQSVIDMSAQKNVTEDYGGSYRSAGRSSERQESSYNVHSYTIGNWWQKLLLILGIIGIVLIVAAVIGGIISLVMPIVIPVLVVILLVNFIRRLKE